MLCLVFMIYNDMICFEIFNILNLPSVFTPKPVAGNPKSLAEKITRIECYKIHYKCITRILIDWLMIYSLIDWMGVYATSAIFQPYKRVTENQGNKQQISSMAKLIKIKKNEKNNVKQQKQTQSLCWDATLA